VRKALADTARAQEQLALEVGKRTDAQASIQAILGLLQDGMANTMSALKHWELDKNSGFQFGSEGWFPQPSTCWIYLHLLWPGLTILQNYLPPRLSYQQLMKSTRHLMISQTIKCA